MTSNDLWERELARTPVEGLMSEVTLHFIADEQQDYPVLERQLAGELLEARQELRRLQRVIAKWSEVVKRNRKTVVVR